MREAMKKYKIAVGICGCTVLYTNIIKAHSEEEAVQKWLAENNKTATEEEFKSYLERTKEYISKPRNNK